MDPEYLSLQEAADLMGVSRFKIWRLVREGKLETFESERDRRERLVRRTDIEALIRPRPSDPAKKVAA
jgi:excisionase family DNA binding protein